MADALYIIAKAPRVGFAKTRLGRAIGHDAAVVLYRAFLQDLAARFARAPFECGWYVTPPDAWDDISPLVDWGEREVRILFQKEGDLTERQRELFCGASMRGEERVVLVASDSPHLTVETVAQAFRELDQHDLVFGPTYDGGYYLIGMRGFNDVFCGAPMSTGSVLGNVVAQAELAGLSVGRIETTFDVDEVEDLEHLRKLVKHRNDLSATRVALQTLGLYEDGRRSVTESTRTGSS
ncbi:MAG: TIGR04282 family arsenosugar biosynthesis glycosyltransferase [Actinomycetota bacterium]|nr:TIGR04282 family arsenosugar biosynthesis glycosyltransferase [Actinomycetota bacterium]